MKAISQKCTVAMTEKQLRDFSWLLFWIAGREWLRSNGEAGEMAKWDAVCVAQYPSLDPQKYGNNGLTAFLQKLYPGLESYIPGWNDHDCKMNWIELACLSYWLGITDEDTQDLVIGLMKQHEGEKGPAIPVPAEGCSDETRSDPMYATIMWPMPEPKEDKIPPGPGVPATPPPKDLPPIKTAPPGTTPTGAKDAGGKDKTNWGLWLGTGAVVIGGLAIFALATRGDGAQPNPTRRKRSSEMWVFLTSTSGGKPIWRAASHDDPRQANLPDRHVYNPPPVRIIGPYLVGPDGYDTVEDGVDNGPDDVDLNRPETWSEVDPNWIDTYLETGHAVMVADENPTLSTKKGPAGKVTVRNLSTGKDRDIAADTASIGAFGVSPDASKAAYLMPDGWLQYTNEHGELREDADFIVEPVSYWSVGDVVVVETKNWGANDKVVIGGQIVKGKGAQATTSARKFMAVQIAAKENPSRQSKASIAKILKAYLRHYSDNDTTVAYVEWVDTTGKKGRTEGPPSNVHMVQLVARARREGVPIEREDW